MLYYLSHPISYYIQPTKHDFIEQPSKLNLKLLEIGYSLSHPISCYIQPTKHDFIEQPSKLNLKLLEVGAFYSIPIAIFFLLLNNHQN